MQITQQGQVTNLGFWGQVRTGLVTFGRGFVAVLRYIFFFVWVVDFARWLVTTGGNIAESAFLLATVYVTINTVAHELVAWLLPGNVILTVNQVSVIAFSVLPELIVFSAIKVTFDHFKMAHSSKRLDAWVWAILYVLPTIVFLILTVLTISSFVSVEATTANAPQATGAMLVTRCLAGWSYGMLQMLWVRLGHEGYSNLFARLRGEIAALGATLAGRDSSIAALEQEKIELQSRVSGLVITLAGRDSSIVTLEQEKSDLGGRVSGLVTLVAARDSSIVVLEQEKSDLQGRVSELVTLVAARDGSIVDLQQEKSDSQARAFDADRVLKLRDNLITKLGDEIEDLKEQNGMLDSELVETRIALARKAGSVDTVDDDSISDAVMSSEKYQKVKTLMQQQLTSGDKKINMRKISVDTGIGYNTVRRYAQSILNGLVDRKTA